MMNQVNSGELMNRIELMLAMLESSQLEVVLAPCKRYANEGGCIRVAANKNCSWYRRFVAQYSSDRRRKNNAFDTKIKRRNCIAALNGILAGRYKGKYYDDFTKIARTIK
mgnify:CR=1 FL=1